MEQLIKKIACDTIIYEFSLNFKVFRQDIVTLLPQELNELIQGKAKVGLQLFIWKVQ